MKKYFCFVMTFVAALGLLSGCGSSGGSSQSQEESKDLTAFYTDAETEYGWGENYMVDIEGEMLESYYPGLADIETKQLIAKMPAMSSVVNEMVLVECANAEDAGAVADILQKRVDDQASGGAWYPESMAAWENAEVFTNGSYVAMFASAKHQSDLGDRFSALFKS